MQINIGCGRKRINGYLGLDRKQPADIIQDAEVYPWAIEDEQFDGAIARHFVEHLNPHNEGFIKFMNEVWRILKPDSEFVIVTPCAGTNRYYKDPTHCNPCVRETFLYFDPKQKSYILYKTKPWRIVENIKTKRGDIKVKLIKINK